MTVETYDNNQSTNTSHDSVSYMTLVKTASRLIIVTTMTINDLTSHESLSLKIPTFLHFYIMCLRWCGLLLVLLIFPPPT